MKNQIKTYQQFTQAMMPINSSIQSLSRLGVYVQYNGCINYEWEKIDYIMNEVNSLKFPFQLSTKEMLALQLACAQETQNEYIDQSQINIVNNFFELDITFDLVQKFNADYI